MLRSGACLLIILLFAATTAFSWTAGEITVDVTPSPMDVKVSAGGKTIANITEFTIGSVRFNSVSNVAENGNTLTLKLSENTNIVITGIEGGINFKSENPSVQSVMLRLKDNGEHFYGITEHNIETNPDLRGKTNIEDRVTAYQRKDEDAEVYSGFFYTTLGYAGYFKSFATGSYSFGASNATTITYNTSNIDWYLFYGPNISKIQKSYFKVIGAPAKVPMWACGPLVWHDDYTGSAMILDHARQFADIRIPYSTIWIDRPYNGGSEGWSNMNFEGDFGNPQVWIKELSEQWYVNLVTWIMPGTFKAAPPAGAFTGSDNNYLDLTDPAQVEWYREKLKTGQYPYGVKGHKLDRIDNGWGSNNLPDFKDGTPSAERHKKYAFLNCRWTHEFLTTDAGLGNDFFVFPRCAVDGCQQFISAIWNGDSYGSWEGMITSIGNAFRAGILGFTMWGSDIGGYTQKSMPDIDRYCRWLSFGVYSGFMELMLDGKEPWKLDAEKQGYIRAIFNERFDLLPYVYSIINTSDEIGVTMMPLVGEYPDDPKTYSLVDEYLFGPAMLVAPISNGSNNRQLYLPAGKWINKHNWADQQVGGKDITSSQMPLTQIPVYIKTNSIYPTGKVFAGLAKKWEPDFDNNRTITINAFPGDPGETVSFTYIDYVDGNKTKVMTLEVDAAGKIAITAPAMTVSGAVAVRLAAAPTVVYSGATPVAAPTYEANKLIVPFAANQPIAVTVNGEPTVKTGSTFISVQEKGVLTALQRKNGLELVIPHVVSSSHARNAEVSIFSLSGRKILKRKVVLSQNGPTKECIVTGKGIFIVKVDMQGTSFGTVKVLVQ